MSQTAQKPLADKWGRPGDDGHLVEVIDFDPTGRFHPSIKFYTIPSMLAAIIDYSYKWDGSSWAEPYAGATHEKLVAYTTNQFTVRIQERLDNFAHTRGYDNIGAACTYANSSIPKFQTEGQYCLTLRDQTWSKSYELLAEYLASGNIPTFDVIEKELPVPKWPDEAATKA